MTDKEWALELVKQFDERHYYGFYRGEILGGSGKLSAQDWG